jgi:putative PEP-CTERM system TPR-repeat lipoprotein
MTISSMSSKGRLAAGLTCLALLSASPPIEVQAATDQSQQFLEDAGRRLERGDLNAAIIQLKNALQQDPSNNAARLLLGQIYLRQEAYADAEKELRRALEGKPSDDVRVLLARALLGLGRHEEALGTIPPAAADAAVRQDAMLVRTEALQRLGRQEEAEAAVREVLRAEPLQPDANLLAAQLAAGRGDVGEATQHLELALEARPDWLAARLFKAQLAMQTGSLSSALETVNQAEGTSPGQLPIALLRSEILVRLGRIEEAETEIRKILKAAPNNVQASFLLASAMAAKGDFGEADRLLRQLGERLSGFPPAIRLTGVVKAQLGQNAQAEQQLGRYLALVPQDRVMRRLLADLRLRAGNPRGAIDILAPVTGAESQDVPSLQLLSSAQLQSGEFKAARTTLQRVVELGQAPYAQQALGILTVIGTGPNAPDSLDPRLRDLVLALDQLRFGRSETALERAQAALDRSPKDLDLLNLVGSIHLLREDNAKAREVFDRALAIDPGSSATLANLDRLDVREGRIAAVEARLRERIASGEPSEDLVMDLARLLVRNGQNDPAQKLLTESLGRLPRSVTLRAALAQLYFQQGNKEALAPITDELVKLAAQSEPNAAQTAAALFLADNNPQQAAAVMQAAVDPRTAEAGPTLLLARATYLAGRHDDARRILTALSERFPTNAIVNTSLIDLDLQQGRTDAALDLARKVKAQDPAQGAILEANLLARTGRNEDAMAVLQSAFQESPSSPLARELFLARWRAERRDEAIEGLAAWLADRPDDALAYTTLSDAYIQRGETARALALLEQAVQLVPNDPRILNNLAWLRAELDRPGAATAARRAYALASGSPEIADTLGWILVRDGQVGEGLALLREAHQSLSDNPDVLYHLAYALEASGDTEEAKRLLRELLDRNASFPARTDAQRLMLKLQDS